MTRNRSSRSRRASIAAGESPAIAGSSRASPGRPCAGPSRVRARSPARFPVSRRGSMAARICSIRLAGALLEAPGLRGAEVLDFLEAEDAVGVTEDPLDQRPVRLHPPGEAGLEPVHEGAEGRAGDRDLRGTGSRGRSGRSRALRPVPSSFRAARGRDREGPFPERRQALGGPVDLALGEDHQRVISPRPAGSPPP